MRDGTVLRADLYRPDDDEAHPVVLARTPYGKRLADPARPWLRFASAGYAVVVQDCRGCFASEGRFVPFADEMDDGYDTVEWVATQPWSTGKVGMFGTSYLGATQWLAAAAGAPHLTTIVPAMTASDYHNGWIYQSGAFLLSFAQGWALSFAMREVARSDWPDHRKAEVTAQIAELVEHREDVLAHRPLRDLSVLDDNGLAGFYREWIDHPDGDAYWRRWRIEAHHDRITIPVLSVSGWYDMFLGGTIRNFLGMRANGGSDAARRHQRLMLGSWPHGKPLFGGNPEPEIDFGPQAPGSAIDVDGLVLRWFDHWLRGVDNSVTDEPPVRVFTLGRNRWQDASSWPLEGTTYVDWYLHSGGRANTASGDGTLSTDPPGAEPYDAYLYDPRHPVPTVGGGAFLNDGARDQRRVEGRAEVLVYSSEPLTAELEVTGPVMVTLWAATSATDTDFTAKLVDVRPDGLAVNLADNVVRARYRNGLDRQELLEHGVAQGYVIDLYATSNVFGPGHRIRVEISSSNHPRFDPNPNTGAPFGTTAEQVVAAQTILHDREHPSRITLPVVGGA